jgi:hypothetical protein
MKTTLNYLLTLFFFLYGVTAVNAVEINIETGSKYESNTVSEGQVTINGKVYKKGSRQMTEAEKKRLNQEIQETEELIENDMRDLESDLESMFE